MAVDANSTPAPDSQSSIKPKREGEKRLTLALDGDTYKRLRLHAAETGQTHQDILEAALSSSLSRYKRFELLPCPFCNSRSLQACVSEDTGWIECFSCGTEGPTVNGGGWSTAWNTRSKAVTS